MPDIFICWTCLDVREPRTLHCLKRFFEGWVRFCVCCHFPEYPWIHTHAAASSATQADACWLHWWWIGSVQDVFCVLRKAHMPSTPSLSSFPSVALESVPMLRSLDLENYLIRQRCCCSRDYLPLHLLCLGLWLCCLNLNISHAKLAIFSRSWRQPHTASPSALLPVSGMRELKIWQRTSISVLVVGWEQCFGWVCCVLCGVK